MDKSWQAKLLFKSKEFNKLIIKARKKLSLSNECYRNKAEIEKFWSKYSKNKDYQNEVREEIKNVINEFGLELFWFMGIFSFILKNKIYKPPSIWIKQKKDKNSNYLSINIAEDISKEALIEWIINNWDKKLKNQLKQYRVENDLPRKMGDFYLYQEIFFLKEKKLSFSEIGKILNKRVLIYKLLRLAEKHKIRIKKPIKNLKDVEEQLDSVPEEEINEIYKQTDKINEGSVKQRYSNLEEIMKK